jgi:hypothetical protein
MMDKIQLSIRLMDGPPGSDRYRGQIVTHQKVPNKGWPPGHGLPRYTLVELDVLDADKFIELYCQRHKIINPLILPSGQIEEPEMVRSSHTILVDDLDISIREQLLQPGCTNIQLEDLEGKIHDNIKDENINTLRESLWL